MRKSFLLPAVLLIGKALTSSSIPLQMFSNHWLLLEKSFPSVFFWRETGRKRMLSKRSLRIEALKTMRFLRSFGHTPLPPMPIFCLPQMNLNLFGTHPPGGDGFGGLKSQHAVAQRMIEHGISGWLYLAMTVRALPKHWKKPLLRRSDAWDER